MKEKSEANSCPSLPTPGIFAATPAAAGKRITVWALPASPPRVPLLAMEGPSNGSAFSHILNSSMVLIICSN